VATARGRNIRLMATSQARAVCVVDDDVSLPRALQILLRAAGFTVGAFGSAEEFLHTARAAVAHYSPSNAFLIAMEVLEQHHDLEQVRALLGPARITTQIYTSIRPPQLKRTGHLMRSVGRRY